MAGKQERGRQTYEHIYAAVLDEFEELGYAGASFSGVATRAGLTKSLVNYHFKTKAQMAVAVFDRAFPEGVFVGAAQYPDPLDRLVRSTESAARAIVENQTVRVGLRLQAERVLIDLDERPSPYAAWIEATRAALDEAIEKQQITEFTDTDEEALLLVAMFAGIREMLPLLRDPGSIVRLAELNTVRRLQMLGAKNLRPPLYKEHAGG